MESTISQNVTSDAADAAAAASALAFSRNLAAACTARAGVRVLGVYLLGSLAHGGFSRRYSDIDMALLLEDADRGTIDDIRRDADAISPALAPKLSLFWADRRFSAGRFPP